MKAEELKNGIKVCHVKHNRDYRVVSSNMRLKDSVNGWVDAVVYAPCYDNEFDCFCREKQSFLEEFEIVEEWSMAKIDLKMTIDYDEQTKTICKYDIADEYTLGEIAVIVAAFKHILMDWGYITKRKEE